MEGIPGSYWSNYVRHIANCPKIQGLKITSRFILLMSLEDNSEGISSFWSTLHQLGSLEPLEGHSFSCLAGRRRKLDTGTLGFLMRLSVAVCESGGLPSIAASVKAGFSHGFSAPRSYVFWETATASWVEALLPLMSEPWKSRTLFLLHPVVGSYYKAPCKFNE